MKKHTPSSWKKALFESIDMINENKESYFENPQTAFSRTQKISLRDTILFPMVASGEATAVELLDYFSSHKLPSQSAMSYRRDQLKSAAYQAVFNDFTAKIPQKKTFHGMRVIACDGTRINTPYNPKDTGSFVQCIPGRKGFNQYHLTTCYDVLNDVFTDAVIQEYYAMNEKLAFCTMLDHCNFDQKAVFVADRGFASHNVIAHAFHSGHYFLIRLTSSMAQSLFRDTQDIADAESIDVEDTYYVGRKRNKETKSLKNYHFKGKNRIYDYIPPKDKATDLFRARLVKFPLPGGGTEYLLTNLSQETFTLADLKELYRIRWCVETSYRYLKYASGLVHMHSIKQKFLFQEIFAKLTLYNFCTAVMQCTKIQNSERTKHVYGIEKTYLIKVCIRFLKDLIHDVLGMIRNRKVPVRAGRKFDRKNIRRQHADTLQYR